MSHNYLRREPVGEEYEYLARVPKHLIDAAKRNITEIVDEDGLQVYGSLNHYIIAAIAKLNREHKE